MWHATQTVKLVQAQNILNRFTKYILDICCNTNTEFGDTCSMHTIHACYILVEAYELTEQPINEGIQVALLEMELC